MKHVTISVSDAMASSKLLGPFFAGPSWDTWRTVIKAAFAEKMSAAEARLVRNRNSNRRFLMGAPQRTR